MENKDEFIDLYDAYYRRQREGKDEYSHTVDLTDEYEGWVRWAKHLKENKNVGMFSALRGLVLTVNDAKHFIHFVTYGISQFFLGVLLAAVERGVTIRGLASNVYPDTLKLINDFDDEYDNFNVVPISKGYRGPEVIPHQKLMVVDGLFALKGSPNLTLSAMEKIEKGADMLEASADLKTIIEDHNDYFTDIYRKWRNLYEEKQYRRQHFDDPEDLMDVGRLILDPKLIRVEKRDILKLEIASQKEDLPF